MVLKTSFLSAAVVALSSLSLSAFAHPFGHSHSHHSGHTHKRQFAGAINQCLHDFAVTFDDGPYIYTQDVITAFNDRSSKTTFYVNGDNWGCIYTKDNYDAVVNAYNSGHQIASHTWSHRDIALLSNEELDFEIQKLDEALVKILGVKPRFVRPPFGSIKPEQVTYLQTVHNKIVVGWDLDSKDTVAATSGGANTAEKGFDFYDDLAAQVIAAGVCPPAPHFTLAHDVQQHSVLATPEALDALLEVGYKLITTAECMDEDPYEYVGEPEPWSDAWTCEAPPSPCPDLEYTSREGDTCTSISVRYQMETSAFQTANSGFTCATSSVEALEVGTPVCVSKPTCPSDYTLFSTINTDTCESLQTLHDIMADEFSAANPGVDCAALQVGTFVCLPPLPEGTCSGQQVPYTVVSGDFCFKIADEHAMTVEELLASNPTLVCENLQIGVQLCVDPVTPENPEDPEDPEDPEEPSTCSVTHTVASGEYCYLIATNNDLTVEQFLALNPGLNCDLLQIGQQVCVKAGTTPEDPEDPEEPVDPEDPEEPVDPEDPEEPVDPEDPEEPVDPEDPEEPVDPEDPEEPVCAWTYTSKADDTCSSIGAEFGMTAEEVKAANNFVNCEDIWEFTPICITTPKPAAPTCLRTYISKPNDTCASIGAAHQMTAAEVKAANDFVNCDDIWEWTSICITTPAPTEPETREPTCAVIYQSRHGEKCSDIESKFGIPTGSVKANNNFVNCDDVWENTSICIPPSDSACTQTYKVPQKTTCAAAGSAYGVNGEVIKYWNDFVDCDDIWAGTDLCVKH